MIVEMSICLVTSEFDGIDEDSEIGIYYRELAILLKEAGWNVVVLYAPFVEKKIDSFLVDFLKKYDIPIYHAKNLIKRNEENSDEILNYIDYISENYFNLAYSHVIYEAIQSLVGNFNYKFNLIEFSDYGAGAVIFIRMKKNFNSHQETKIIVKLHGSRRWILESERQAFLDPLDVRIESLSKYSFENADIQVSSTRYLLNWCRDRGWKVKENASLCRNPTSLAINREYPMDWDKRDKIAFYGRYEKRKGILEFINALKYIESIDIAFPDRYSIVFLGSEDIIEKNFIQSNLLKFKCEFKNLGRYEAIRYLKEKAKLVVIPYVEDNWPYAILDCMCTNLPIITSQGGGIPEMLGIGSNLYRSISSDTNDPEAFGDLILRYLRIKENELYELLGLASQRVAEVTNPNHIIQWYKNLYFEKNSICCHKFKGDNPGVTIIIPTQNLTTERYLEVTLSSLMNQTYKNIKIIVNDASTELLARQKFDYLDNKYKNNDVIKFMHSNHKGIGNALNQVLPNVETKYVMEVDGDNIAKQDMIETFVECIENREDVAALSCYNKFFNDLDEEKILSLVNDRDAQDSEISNKIVGTPEGLSLPILFFENTGGDANSIYLTDAVKQMGGWPEDRRGFQDWSMWIKLIANGYNFDVIPKILYYYRDNPSGDSRKKKLLYVDNNNIQYIKKLIKNRPEYFRLNCYEGLHRLARRTITAYQERILARHERDVANHERNLARHERDVANHERNLARHERDVANHERDLARHERDVANHERDLATQERDVANHERDLATQERDVANHERDLATQERDVANHERDLATQERDVANHERDLATQERDVANHERDLATQERDVANHERDVLLEYKITKKFELLGDKLENYLNKIGLR